MTWALEACPSHSGGRKDTRGQRRQKAEGKRATCSEGQSSDHRGLPGEARGLGTRLGSPRDALWDSSTDSSARRVLTERLLHAETSSVTQPI